jgi:hypothetical protein
MMRKTGTPDAALLCLGTRQVARRVAPQSRKSPGPVTFLSLLVVAWFALPIASSVGQEKAATDVQDEQLRRLVVGTWQDDYQGKRTKTLDEDGTGKMIVELEGLKARLFAQRLTFEMVWSVENGRLKKQTIKGEPAVKVQMILKTMGDRVDERILELDNDRLLLLDKDGKTKYDWRRVKPETQP